MKNNNKISKFFLIQPTLLTFFRQLKHIQEGLVLLCEALFSRHYKCSFDKFDFTKSAQQSLVVFRPGLRNRELRNLQTLADSLQQEVLFLSLFFLFFIGL